MRRSLLAILAVLTLATAALAAGNWAVAQSRAAGFKASHKALAELAPKETASLVAAICEADEDERATVADDASKRVQAKVSADYKTLAAAYDDAYESLGEVIKDPALSGVHPDAQALLRDIVKRKTSIDKMVKGLRGANHPVVQYTLREGQKAHTRRQTSTQHCTVFEFDVGGGRADCVYAPDCMVIEFKPDNKLSIAKGQKQVERYADKLNTSSALRADLVAEDKQFAKCEEFTYRVDCYTLCPDIDPETNDYVSAAVSWRLGC